MSNKKGFSLVELAIGLAVITILILAVAASSGVRDSARVQSAASSVQTLRAAAENYLASGNLNYSGLNFTALQTANLLPAGFDPSASNPWGGSFAIGPDSLNNTRFQIALNALNQAQASVLTNIFKNSASSSAYDASQSTWTVVF